MVSSSSSRESKRIASAAISLKVSSAVLRAVCDASPDRLVEAIKLLEDEKKPKKLRPSAMGTRSAERNVQFELRGGPKFLCYRGPPEAVPSLPLVLAHKPFLDFRSNAASMQAESEDWICAQKLLAMCTAGWDDETKQMTPQLNQLFSRLLGLYVSRSEVQGNFTDGSVDSSLIYFVHKLVTDEGYLQGLEYFEGRFLSAREMGLSNSCGMLILIPRPYIQAVAVAMDWKTEKIVAEPLTDMINCFGAPQHELKKLASFLRALRLYCRDLDLEAFADPRVPYMLRDKQVEQLHDKLLFLVEPDRVVKLAMEYCGEAHRLWADKGLAPPLYRLEAIGAGWLLVEMAFLGTKDGWVPAQDIVLAASGDPVALQSLGRCIEDAVKKGHMTGYVHGDMRLPNIKVRQREQGFDVMFLDFDWSGKVGKATYPVGLNPDITWHKDASVGRTIHKEHDLHFIHRLVDQLKEC